MLQEWDRRRTGLYFAYGSNMSTPRLQARLPHARPLGPAWLDGHRLAFGSPLE